MQEIVSREGEEIACLIRGRTILRNDYILPGAYSAPRAVRSGDYMIILDAGSYCATQHMEFLNVPPAPEVLFDREGRAHLITNPGDEMDRWRHVPAIPSHLPADLTSALVPHLDEDDTHEFAP